MPHRQLGPQGKKNFDNYCLKCSKPKCEEALMPKMVVKPLDKYNKKFSIAPNKPLQKDFTDWDKRIKAHIQGQGPKDSKFSFGVKKDNRVSLGLESSQNFKNKKLEIEVADVKGIYDLKGNAMHQTKVDFFIKNYVKHSDEMKESMGTAGALCKL